MIAQSCVKTRDSIKLNRVWVPKNFTKTEIAMLTKLCEFGVFVS